MKERKYKEDWRNETRMDDRGREKRVPVYRGSWFLLPEGVSVRSLRLWATLPWAGYLAALLLYFRLNFPGATVMYVFLPAALSLFPVLYWAMGAAGVFRAPRRMTRLQKENGIGRVLRSSAGCAICLCAALVGDLVLMLTGGQVAREWPGTLLLLLALALAAGAASRFREILRGLSEEEGDPE